MHHGALGGQKRQPDSLSNRQLYTSMWVLGTKPWSSGKAARALSPEPSLQLHGTFPYSSTQSTVPTSIQVTWVTRATITKCSQAPYIQGSKEEYISKRAAVWEGSRGVNSEVGRTGSEKSTRRCVRNATISHRCWAPCGVGWGHDAIQTRGMSSGVTAKTAVKPRDKGASEQ